MSRLKLSVTLALMLLGFTIHFNFQETLLPPRQAIEDFHFPDLLGLICNASNVIAAIIAIFLTKTVWRCSPFPFILVAIPQRLAFSCQTWAQLHIDYPTLQLSKAIKPIAILIAMTAVERRCPTVKRAVVLAILCAGFALFGFAGKFEHSSVFGFLLLAGSMFFDSIYVPIVDYLKVNVDETGRPRPFVVMLYAQGWSFLIYLGLRFRDSIDGMRWIAAHPEILPKLALYAVAGSVGHLALFSALGMTDGLVVGIATTCRKLLTIIYSALAHKHHLRPLQWTGVFIVFGGLALEHAWSWAEGVKQRKKGEEKKAEGDVR
jgi:UDP-galactose transporter B1